MPSVQADRLDPRCPKCGTAKAVVPLHAVRLREGAHCYACKDCGHVFGACVDEARAAVEREPEV